MIDGLAYTEEEKQECELLQKAVEANFEKLPDLHSFEELLDWVKTHLSVDTLHVAVHILKALEAEMAEYYRYNITMGVVERPIPIDSVDELADVYEDVFYKE